MLGHAYDDETMGRYFLQLGAEAFFTGLSAIPLIELSSRLTKQRWVAMFVGAAAYHLLAEAVGMNEWYIFHGAAALRNQHRFKQQQYKGESSSRKECHYLHSASSYLVSWPSQDTRSTNDSLCVRYPPAK